MASEIIFKIDAKNRDDLVNQLDMALTVSGWRVLKGEYEVTVKRVGKVKPQPVSGKANAWNHYQLTKPEQDEADTLATTCFHCGDSATPETHGFDPRCERHRDV